MFSDFLFFSIPFYLSLSCLFYFPYVFCPPLSLVFIIYVCPLNIPRFSFRSACPRRQCTFLNKEADAFCGLCKAPWEPSLGAPPAAPSPRKPLTCPPGYVLVPTGNVSLVDGVARDEFRMERAAAAAGGATPAAPAVAAEKDAAAAPAIEEMDVEFDDIDGFEIMASSVERP